MRHLRWPVLGSLGLTAVIGSELFDCRSQWGFSGVVWGFGFGGDAGFEGLAVERR